MDASELIALYKAPRHWGAPAEATHSGVAENPLCGDGLSVGLSIRDGVVEAVGFEGNSCSVSVATASLLGDRLVGASLEDVGRISGAEAVSLTGVPRHRHRCALLPLKAVLVAVESDRAWDALEREV